MADEAALADLPANCWVLNQFVPGGYTPRFGGNLKDASIVGGVRGQANDRLSYDVSASYGRNKVSFFLGNTWNPSNGPDGGNNGGTAETLQRSFELGSYVQSETNFNADFVYLMPVSGFASDLSFAFGAEWRDERFETIIGEEAAWEAGPYAFQNRDGSNRYDLDNEYSLQPFTHEYSFEDDDGVRQTRTIQNASVVARLPNLSIGAHGFAGFSPPQAGLWGRSNYALYGELGADFSDAFSGQVALRFEDFDSFGTTTNYKVAGRYAITDNFALRASYNTGFRAPTPGQENVTKISTITVEGELQQQGQIPPTNPIAGYPGR